MSAPARNAAATLAVLAPLRIEAAALRRGDRALPVTVVGMGRRRATLAGQRLGAALAPGRPVAVIGVGGGVAPDVRPGTLVVGTEVRGPAGTRRLHGAPLLARALAGSGCAVTTGPVVSTERVVRGADRARLAAEGAVVADMETAWLLDALDDADGGRPLAVVRAVADVAGRGPIGAARGGVSALSALARVGPALSSWARATGQRQVVLAGPRSFCAGVERAIEIVRRALARFGSPVYVRRQIVHNRHVVEQLEDAGAVFVEELGEVPRGAVVVLSAHGVAPAVRAEAVARDLQVIDATCPLVAKVHSEARRFAGKGYELVLVGHAGHDETIGTLGEADGIHLVADVDDVAALEVPDGARIAYLTQTTLATDETATVVAALARRFPDLAGPAAGDICYATQNRQDALRAVAEGCDLVLVVSSSNSSNGRRLQEVARRQGAAAYLVDDADALELSWLEGVRRVGVTAAASTPESYVTDVVEAIAGLGPIEVTERTVTTENVRFSLPPEVR